MGYIILFQETKRKKDIPLNNEDTSSVSNCTYTLGGKSH